MIIFLSFMKIQITTKAGKRSLTAARRNYHQWRNRSKQSKIYLGTLFALCDGVCPYCNCDMVLSFNHGVNQRNNAATLDHITPLSKLLEHKKYGLEIMCRQCNVKKGSKRKAVEEL